MSRASLVELTNLCVICDGSRVLVQDKIGCGVVFPGELNSSEEGRMFWIEREEFAKTNTIWGMNDVLRVCDEAKYSEMFYSEEKEGWVLLG